MRTESSEKVAHVNVNPFPVDMRFLLANADAAPHDAEATLYTSAQEVVEAKYLAYAGGMNYTARFMFQTLLVDLILRLDLDTHTVGSVSIKAIVLGVVYSKSLFYPALH
jgi:hypothetical protein